ncbi:hypothetical protein DPMN_012395 [Dreissena polymorpha]|uniref:Uncharacterized protein n=1 Tax=Dreissena polymorpha TaxID=45954 RepID=A0A9D4S3B8_DREPO|nr:hypothetical protein DPMN_012395 [Dreissena polymorpha]
MQMDGHERIVPVSMPTVAITEGEPTFKEVQEIIKKARSKLAPGPNILQGVQLMSKTAETVVETIEGGLAQRRCTCGVPASRRHHRPKGGGFQGYWNVPDNIITIIER